MASYYNEHDPHAAKWLRALIAEGLIVEGFVDEKDIQDVRPSDLAGFTQCHFFAGIGGWSLALRLAGWSDDRPCWTGSAPCQPFSIANVKDGGGKGRGDSRHLFPAFCDLVRELKPTTVFGEQVVNAISKGWLDEAFGEMESFGYACAAAIMPAIAVGTRHERERLYWVAETSGAGRQGHQQIERLSVAETETFPVYGDPLADARQALDGDISGLLPCDGLSVVMERSALKGYGNAICPQVAKIFIESIMECQP
jgi:DNA (cytosine-5)-methyltransferase 1